jgi:hypothetical protein
VTLWEAFVDTVLIAGGVLLKIEALTISRNVQSRVKKGVRAISRTQLPS